MCLLSLESYAGLNSLTLLISKFLMCDLDHFSKIQSHIVVNVVIITNLFNLKSVSLLTHSKLQSNWINTTSKMFSRKTGYKYISLLQCNETVGWHYTASSKPHVYLGHGLVVTTKPSTQKLPEFSCLASPKVLCYAIHTKPQILVSFNAEYSKLSISKNLEFITRV